MQLSNNYYYFKEAIPPETCQRIINLGVEKINAEREKGHNVEAYTFGDEQKSAKPDAAPQGEMTKQQLLKKGIWPEQIPSMPDNYNEIVKEEMHELKESMLYFRTELVSSIQGKIFTGSLLDMYYVADYNYRVNNIESLINDGLNL
jgi:hypothetical protein